MHDLIEKERPDAREVDWTYPDGQARHTWHPAEGVLVTFGVGEQTEAVHLHVHDIIDARDRVALIARDLPQHEHGWTRGIGAEMRCMCGAVLVAAYIVHPS